MSRYRAASLVSSSASAWLASATRALIVDSHELLLQRVLGVVDHLERRRRAAAEVDACCRRCVDVGGHDQRAEHVAVARPSASASARVATAHRVDRLEQLVGVALDASSCWPPTWNATAPGGTWLRNATRGLSGPRDSARPISTAIDDRVDDQQRHQQRRAPQDLQVLAAAASACRSVARARAGSATNAASKSRVGRRRPPRRSSAGVPANSSSPSASTSTRSA